MCIAKQQFQISPEQRYYGFIKNDDPKLVWHSVCGSKNPGRLSHVVETDQNNILIRIIECAVIIKKMWYFSDTKSNKMKLKNAIIKNIKGIRKY